MAESKNSKRVIFRPGEQKRFLLEVKEKIDVSWKSIAESLGVNPRTVSAWRNEENSLTFGALSILCELASFPIPADIEVRDQYWYVGMAAKKGGMVNYKINGKVGGDEKHRKEQWQKWWDDKGKFKLPQTKARTVSLPSSSEKLAEFIGIILGDGGVTRNQITITLHKEDDKEYSKFVKHLIGELFSVIPGEYIIPEKEAKRLVISRRLLVEYLGTLGIKRGSKVKNQVDIPGWILTNTKYKKACLRGLIDTDGCIILHKYRSKGRIYRYKKISLTNRAYPLLLSASSILTKLGIQHRITKNCFEIRIEAQSEVEKYFQYVGTNNPKHLSRYASV